MQCFIEQLHNLTLGTPPLIDLYVCTLSFYIRIMYMVT